MRVLVFTQQFHQLGGAERLGVELAEQLNRRDIRADIMSMYTEDLPGAAEAREKLLRRGIPAVHFLGMRVHPPLTSIVPAIRRLRRLVHEQQYDLVETSSVTPTVIASWATRGTRTRHVSGLHQVFRADRENRLVHRCWRLSVRSNRRIRYYAISDCAAEQWVQYSHTSPRHTRRIYDAIPDDCFEAACDRIGVRRELGIPEDARIALYVGRLAAYKGINTVLDALGPVLDQERLHLLYVGRLDVDIRGTEEMLRQMKSRIAMEHWDEKVGFLGFRSDIPRLMASSDVLAHPTRIEGFGLALVEALAAGLPVVASNVEGIPEVLAGTDSIMVSPDDPVALRAAVLRTLHRRPDEAASAIEKGRARAEAFRLAKRTDAMVRLFEDVLSGRF